MYRLGVDLGGTNIVAGVVDENFKIIATGKRKTNFPRPAEEIVKDIAAAVKDAICNAKIDVEDIISFGIGSPGAINSKDGIVERADNLGF